MPGWAWVAKHNGKDARGWTSGSRMLTEEDVKQEIIRYFHNVDVTEFKCERKDDPPLIVRPPPASWYLYGTTRMKAEIEAGLRTHSDTLLPPIDGVNHEPLIKKLIVPLSVSSKKVQPLSKRR